MRYAVRLKQISDSVFCQRSAIVISADAFWSTPRNVFHTVYDARRLERGQWASPVQSITIFSMFFKRPPKIRL